MFSFMIYTLFLKVCTASCLKIMLPGFPLPPRLCNRLCLRLFQDIWCQGTIVTNNLQHTNVSTGAQNSYLVTALTQMEHFSTSLNQIPVAMVPSHLQITSVTDSSHVLCAQNEVCKKSGQFWLDHKVLACHSPFCNSEE